LFETIVTVETDQPANRKIRAFGQWIIFAGIGNAFLIAVMLLCDVKRLVGEKASPYVAVGLVGATILALLWGYDRCPKRMLIPLGCVGWSIMFLLLLLDGLLR
jgi:hypothetical protein